METLKTRYICYGSELGMQALDAALMVVQVGVEGQTGDSISKIV